jgi:hypothetical protein
VSQTNDLSYEITFTSDSSLSGGLHMHAAMGGGPSHRFQVDTGSVGILVPRAVLGGQYQSFDPSQDIEFQYVSDGRSYWGQWVSVPVFLGVPSNWDGTGDYPTTQIEVFAVDHAFDGDKREDFVGGMLGIGFAIGGKADGGPARNPLLNLTYQGMSLSAGYIISSSAIELGLTSTNTAGFAFIQLTMNDCGTDWMQPQGSVAMSGPDITTTFQQDLPVLMDTGIAEMILWLSADLMPLKNVAVNTQFPPNYEISIALPPTDTGTDSVLQYSFTTGDSSQPMSPSEVVWNIGSGINTGANVLAGYDYLYDSDGGRIGFRAISATPSGPQ